MRGTYISRAGLASLAMLGGCYGEAYVEPTPAYQATVMEVPYDSAPTVAVSVAPPPPRYETVISCGYGTSWVPGRWDWRNNWLWARGYCAQVRPGYVYTAPRYTGGVYYRAYWAPAGGAMVAPPAPGVVVAPRYGGTYVAPPAPGAVVAPRYGGTYVAPPAPGAVVAPRYGGTYVAPPAPGTAVGPSYGGGTYVAPPAPGATVAPRYGGGTYAAPPAPGGYVRPAQPTYTQPAPYRPAPAPAYRPAAPAPAYRPATPAAPTYAPPPR